MSKSFISLAILIGLLSFIFGWLFPVEGPFDESYEDFTSYHKMKRNKGVATPQVKKEVFIVTDEEVEQYYLIPFEIKIGDT